MKKENLERGNDIQRSIRSIKENICRLEHQLEMLEQDTSGDSKSICQFMIGNYNFRRADYNKLSLLDFVSSQISRDRREVEKLEREFDNL